MEKKVEAGRQHQVVGKDSARKKTQHREKHERCRKFFFMPVQSRLDEEPHLVQDERGGQAKGYKKAHRQVGHELIRNTREIKVHSLWGQVFQDELLQETHDLVDIAVGDRHADHKRYYRSDQAPSQIIKMLPEWRFFSWHQGSGSFSFFSPSEI